MNQRRLSLPFTKICSPPPEVSIELHEEHPVGGFADEDVNLDSLEAFLEELLDLHSYGVQLLKVLKQKYIKISDISDPPDIKNLKDRNKKHDR